MSEQYRSMWADLGLDLETHDALLAAVGEQYQSIFLSQKDRPEKMNYFDFVVSEVHGLRIKELVDAQAEGRKIIGSFCVFVPEELILAVDGISIGLCAGAEFGFDEAEKYLPRNTCSLIKSFFGFKLKKVCPYMESCDLIVGEATCDGKKKAYELFDTLTDNLYIMDMPQRKTDEGRQLLFSEYSKFVSKLEELSGKKITVSKLKESIETVNKKRQAVSRLNKLRAASPSPISGLDALLIQQIYFYDDPIRYTASVNALCDELEEKIKNNTGNSDDKKARLLLAGCPMALPNWKVPSIVENGDAVIVGEESCVGERGIRNLVESSGETVEDLLHNIVDRYFKINCAIFTPNTARLDDIRSMVKKYKADGVIHYNLQFCQPYQIESGAVENKLEAEAIPVLRLDTDYSMEDVGQIQTRVEAFVERVKG